MQSAEGLRLTTIYLNELNYTVSPPLCNTIFFSLSEKGNSVILCVFNGTQQGKLYTKLAIQRIVKVRSENLLVLIQILGKSLFYTAGVTMTGTIPI